MVRRSEELGEREIAALYQENHGNKYQRQHAIAERALDARFAAAEAPIVLCDFKNIYGWCKLSKGHIGTHTVRWLGDDGD